MEILLPATTIAALFGAYLNSSGKKEGFIVWMATNAVFMVHNFLIGEYSQAVLFTCYLGITVYGWMQWTKKNVAAKAQA